MVIAIIAGPDRPAAPRRPVRPRGGTAHPVHEQPQADRPRLHNYHSSVKHFRPAGMIAPLTNWWVAQGLTWPGHFRYSFLPQIMPYMEQTATDSTR